MAFHFHFFKLKRQKCGITWDQPFSPDVYVASPFTIYARFANEALLIAALKVFLPSPRAHTSPACARSGVRPLVHRRVLKCHVRAKSPKAQPRFCSLFAGFPLRSCISLDCCAPAPCISLVPSAFSHCTTGSSECPRMFDFNRATFADVILKF